ncbi:diaminopimelate epimerase [Clostridium scatologenes]|uniref:Diaminopimelate epimerase n=1 Tax=Clostridium scatologenes TaxID=1548 RepID=A0A0E3K1R9_CLOSL|nr:diaminopimelate epimerase [Clostridium scatologenes]AKA70220.1 diaminopimelate epimerase [Clostridium scatologenes]
MKFTKMQGTGNDFIVIDDRKNSFLGKEGELAKKLCDRKFAIGADGILLVRNSDIAQIKMIIMNADGSYASMCGNGIRCFAKYVWDENIVKGESITIETGDGIKEAILHLENHSIKEVTINMGTPSFEVEKIPARFNEEVINKRIKVENKEYNITSMLMGVPHTIIFGKLEDYNVEEGKAIEKSEFFPDGTNVNFCEVVSSNKVKVKTWERGAGPTLACGTGSCASVIAANRLTFTSESVEVKVPGGKLFIEIKKNGIFMTGPAVVSFKGEYEL